MAGISEWNTLNNNRNRRLERNIHASLLLQITTIICGFILPRLILGAFGSEINGLVTSITQFLGVITLLDLGVSAVVQSSLYRPLAESDTLQISRIYCSAQRFFRRLALILLCYVVVLMVVYPLLVRSPIAHMDTAILIGTISISTFAQYYFGVVNRLLLSADQRGYVQYTVQIVVLLLNTLACWILIRLGASIQMVKLATSCVFLLRPLYLAWYVHRHYSIDQSVTWDAEPIRQKWNGIAQHMASFVLCSTDDIVLTLFSTLSTVSVYAVYNMVIMGVKNLLMSSTGGVQSLMGELYVKGETEALHRFFGKVEWALHTAVTLLFGCTGILIVEFVSVYTNGIQDTNYIQPLFAALLTAANAGHCLRLPYNLLILAAGHYRETQHNYIIAMLLNIGISVTTVHTFGLIGVAVGTLVAMCYQTVWMAWYDSEHIIRWPLKNFFRQMAVDLLTVGSSVLCTVWIPLRAVSYGAWLVLAVEVFVIWSLITLAFNMVFYHERLSELRDFVLHKWQKHRSSE